MPIIVPQQQTVTPTVAAPANAATSNPAVYNEQTPSVSASTNIQDNNQVSEISGNTTNVGAISPVRVSTQPLSEATTMVNQTLPPPVFTSHVPNTYQTTAARQQPLTSTLIDPFPAGSDNVSQSNSFSIELFDTVPAVDIYQQQSSTTINDSQPPVENPDQTKLRHLVQQQYNQYYQQYKMHQELQKHKEEGQGINNESVNTSSINEQTMNTSKLNTSVFTGDEVSTIAEIEAEFKASTAPAANTENQNVPPVPISHLLAGNEYPSLQKQPTPAIVQSFPPVYVQQSGSATQHTDIYQEYVQNPYNLTLQQSQMSTGVPLVSVEQHQQNLLRLQMQYEQQQQQQQRSQEAFNTPANYFTSTGDPNSVFVFGEP